MVLRTSVTGGNWRVLIEINDSFIKSHFMIIRSSYSAPSRSWTKVLGGIISIKLEFYFGNYEEDDARKKP